METKADVALIRIAVTLRVLRAIVDAAPEYGTKTINQLRIVSCVAYHNVKGNGLPTQTKLAQDLKLPKATVFRTVRELQERGVVVPTRNPDDRRVIELALTHSGYQEISRWAAKAHII